MLTPTQKRAVRALELALQGMARHRLAVAPLSTGLVVVPTDERLVESFRALGPLALSHRGCTELKHHGVFLSGGGA